MQEQNTNAGQGLGIAGLVLGVMAIPLGLIPCTFFIALVFGAVGIVLSAIALSQANRGKGPRGLIIVALACSIMGFSFAFFWGIALKNASPVIKGIIQEIRQDGDIEKVFEDLGDDSEKMLEDTEIKTDDANQGTDQKADEKEKALEDSLKVLEGVK
jgi:hypothetical protein